MRVVCAAGGTGSRLYPATNFINKHLLPTGKGKLMIDHPLEFIASHDIKNVTIITGNGHATQICDYIRDGNKYGFEKVDYAFQPEPKGIADVLKRVHHTDSKEGILLILGDNFFSEKIVYLNEEMPKDLASCWEYDVGSIELAKSFGQVTRDQFGNPVSIVEKPKTPTCSRIITGLYYFPNDVFERVEKLSPSARGELEITDLLRMYLEEKRLAVNLFEGWWADLGEHESWANFVAKNSGIAVQ